MHIWHPIETFSAFVSDTLECWTRSGLGVYSGTISATETGKPCKALAEDTVRGFRNIDFPMDDSVFEARNYCRNHWFDPARIWCLLPDGYEESTETCAEPQCLGIIWALWRENLSSGFLTISY